MHYVRVGLHGPGWLYVLGMPPRADVPLSPPTARATDLGRGPNFFGVRAGSLCATEPRARGKTRGRKRKKCRRVKTTHLYTFIYTYTYIYVYTNRHLRSEQLFWRENENSTPRRETTRAPPRPPPAKSGEASKARHDEQTAQRTVDLISSYQ